MRKNRKSAYCLNCGQALSEEENYCPNCGQENKDQRVSINIFLQDFASNYLSFDTTFFRTVKPFLFSPGKLTEAFNSGKRRKYIHPIRLYLIFSLFYFFVLSLTIPKDILDNIVEATEKDSSPLLEEEAASQLEDLDSVLNQSRVELQDSAAIPAVPKDSITFKQRWREIKFAAMDPDVGDEAFEKKLRKYNIYFESIGTEKTRTFIANSNLFIANSARNLPIMMFLLLPFFAGILMLLHLGSRKYYVEHLIHGLNLHSFAYFTYGTGIIILFFFVKDYQASLINICFLIVSIYAFLSVRRIYRNGWFKALLKFLILGFLYFILLLVAVGMELYFSLMML